MKRFVKKLFCVSLAAALITSLTGCSGSGAKAAAKRASGSQSASARTVANIKSSGKIIIGVFSDKKPFGYVDSNGTYQGYDVYFGNRIAKDLGVKAEYVSTEPASRV